MNNTTAWRKSTFSNDQSMCVEINGTLDAIRDSKNHGPELTLAGQALPALIRRVKSDLHS